MGSHPADEQACQIPSCLLTRSGCRSLGYNDRMEPTPELIDHLYREEIEAARQMTGEQRLLAGGDLFDAACQITLAGIRSGNPNLTQEELLDKLRERLQLGRLLERNL